MLNIGGGGEDGSETDKYDIVTVKDTHHLDPGSQLIVHLQSDIHTYTCL